jgi:hypothetical protein
VCLLLPHTAAAVRLAAAAAVTAAAVAVTAAAAATSAAAAAATDAQGTASQQEPTLGFGIDADMQAEADDADTQQQHEQQDAAALGYSDPPPLQHMLPGLLGHDTGALLEQKGAFFRKGGAVAGSDFEFVAIAGRGTDVTSRRVAAVPPSFARTHGAAASGGRYRHSAFDTSIQQDDLEFTWQGQGQTLEHNWVRKRPALLQTAQQRQQLQDQQRAVIRLDDEQQQEQHQQRPAGAAAGSALLVRPVGLQDLQLQLAKAAAAPTSMQQQPRSAAITPLLPATAAISSSAAAVDAALMLGRSFRAGWGPGGQLVVPCNPRCNPSSSSSRASGQQQQQQQQVLPFIELRQLSPLAYVSLPGSSSSTTAGQAAAVAGMQERILSGLQLHLDHSQPTGAAAAAAAGSGAWQLVGDSRAIGGYVSNQLAAMDAAASVASEAAARSRDGDSSSSSSTAVAAAGCTDHLRQLWRLLQLLYESIEGQDDDLDDSAAAAAGYCESDADMGEGQEGYRMADGAVPFKQFALAAMQRKANLSTWLQLKLRPQVCGRGVQAER